MHSSDCTNKRGRLYSGGRQCSSGDRLSSAGGILSAASSETARQSGCGTMTSTAEVPTDVCLILTASPSRCIVGGSAAGSNAV